VVSANFRPGSLAKGIAFVQVVNRTLDVLGGTDVLPFWQPTLGCGRIGDDYLFDSEGNEACVVTWRSCD